MKIGLMTWYKYHNYGTVLQAYALYKKIRDLGYNPYMINYKPREKNRYLQRRKDIPQKIKNKLIHRHLDFSKVAFDDFICKNFTETSECNTYIELKELNNQFQAFICGSDQIWSSYVFDEKYFLNFADENKIISYAPSLGSSEVTDGVVRDRMKHLISRFKYLSVREETGKKIIFDVASRDAKVTLDPTLLLSKDEWEESLDLETTNSKQEKYALCYFLGSSDKYVSQIETYAKNNGLKIINIPFLKNAKINKYTSTTPIGPREFVNLIKDAQVVFTDSFHGIIFSINFNTNFFAYKRFKDNEKLNQNSRVLDILKKLNLEGHLVNENFIPSIEEADFRDVNARLAELREDSLDFLSSSLKKVTFKEAEHIFNLGFITEYCVGCSACSQLCPTKCIKMEKNSEGFLHYAIDVEKCIKCGLCKKVCPMVQVESHDMRKSKKLYAFKAKNLDTLANSSSGGFSDVVAFLRNDEYYICGCQYNNEKHIAEHIIIPPNSKEELSKIRGSKYLQSHTFSAFQSLLKLPKDAKVIFIGTPCQVAGLDKMLKIRGLRENYILIDLICHGVPSSYLWDKYFKSIVNEHNLDSTCISVKFRDKQFGWRTRRLSISDGRNKYVCKESKDNFYAFFRRGVVDMKSCYECPYRTKSSADIRIGDYWGNRFIKDKSGVSMVIVHSEKGQELFEEIKNNDLAICHEYSLNEYWSIQYPENLNEPLFRDELIEKIKDNRTHLGQLRKEYLEYEDSLEVLRKIKNKIIK